MHTRLHIRGRERTTRAERARTAVAYSRRFITRPASRRCRLGMSNDTFARMRGVSRSPDTPRSRNRTAGAVVPSGNTTSPGYLPIESAAASPRREFLALMQMRAVVHFVVHGAVVVSLDYLRFSVFRSLAVFAWHPTAQGDVVGNTVFSYLARYRLRRSRKSFRTLETHACCDKMQPLIQQSLI